MQTIKMNNCAPEAIGEVNISSRIIILLVYNDGPKILSKKENTNIKAPQLWFSLNRLRNHLRSPRRIHRLRRSP